MFLKQLNKSKFDYFQEQLIQKAHQSPLNAAFHVPMTVNRREYLLKVQPTTKCRIAVLQALMIERELDEGIVHTLITDNKVLLALFELLLFQGTV